jgi:methylenetetrahydrofolate reductase (NADPH)
VFNYPYIVELLSPKRSADDQMESMLVRFAERYQRVMAAGLGLSIPDNPMGQPRLGALECIDLCGLSVDPEKIVMNLNTFHTKSSLDELLQKAADVSLKYILIVRGDGGPLLPKIDAESIGGKRSVATSTDLIRYVNHRYPGQFVTGAAFNPYKPMPFEFDRLRQKIDAGAEFVVTQPIIGQNEHVDELESVGVDVVVEAWMSNNIDLLLKSVGRDNTETVEAYNPAKNLEDLHKFYPTCCVYLSMLSFKKNWSDLLPRLTA